LDKSSNLKSGGIFVSKIDNDKILNNYTINKNKSFFYLDYGILEFKIRNNLLFSSNSNCSFSIFQLKENYDELNFTLKKNFQISKDYNENCCNFIELNEFNHDQILLAMNDGSFNLFDINKEKVIFNNKGHDYGLWSTHILNQNIFLTGSEDSLMKMWDNRTNTWYIHFQFFYNFQYF